MTLTPFLRPLARRLLGPPRRVRVDLPARDPAPLPARVAKLESAVAWCAYRLRFEARNRPWDPDAEAVVRLRRWLRLLVEAMGREYQP